MELLLFSLTSWRDENGFSLFQRVTGAMGAFALLVASPVKIVDFNPQTSEDEARRLSATKQE
jgi:hypothetical protein